MKIKSTIAFLFFVISLVNAQSTVKISGKVVDAQSNKELVGANIIVESTAVGAVSDMLGRFAIENLLNGSYTLRAEFMGYTTISKIVQVSDGEPAFMVFRLQPDVLQMDDISVSADRFTSSLHQNGFDVLIDRAHIRQRQTDDLAQLLQTVPGVQVTESGVANSQKISIRGSQSNQVLVFVDGVKINDEITGEVDLSQIPVNSIENINVKKGAASAVYGSGAIGGAVHITTIQGTEKSAQLLTTLGPYQYVRLEPYVNGRLNRFVYTLSYQSLQAQGNYPYSYRSADDITLNATRANADIFSQNAFIRAGYMHGDHQLSIRAQHYSAIRGLPGKVNYLTRYARSKNTREIYQLDYRFCTSTMFFRADAYVNQYQTENSNFWPEDAELIDRQYPRIHLKNVHESVGGHFYFDHVSKWINSQFGIEIRNSSYRDKNILYPGYNNIGSAENLLYAAFLKQTYDLRSNAWQLILEPAFRYDYALLHSSEIRRIEQQTSPGIHAFLAFGKENRVFTKAAVHSAFRLPTFADLFYQDFRVQGKADLLPEKSVNTEFGGGFRFRRASFQVLHFHYSIDDMIVWRLGSFEVFQPYNNNAEISGQEYTFSVESPSVFKLDASYTHVRALNKNDNQTLHNKFLIYKPKDAGTLSLSGIVLKWRHSLQYRYTGTRFVTDANTIAMPDFQVYDWSADHAFHFKRFTLNLQFKIVNLLNEQYEIIRDMPLPGREWRVGLSLQYK